MTPKDMALLHARCFDETPRPWSPAEFAAFHKNPRAFILTCEGGFVIGQIMGPEAELLTICVDPAMQKRGIGAKLLANFAQAAKQENAEEAFLEVAESNLVARRLYERCGWRQVAVRPQYYKVQDGRTLDAIIMRIGF